MSNDSLRTLYTYMRVQLDTDGGKGSLSVETDIWETETDTQQCSFLAYLLSAQDFLEAECDSGSRYSIVSRSSLSTDCLFFFQKCHLEKKKIKLW